MEDSAGVGTLLERHVGLNNRGGSIGGKETLKQSKATHPQKDLATGFVLVQREVTQKKEPASLQKPGDEETKSQKK